MRQPDLNKRPREDQYGSPGQGFQDPVVRCMDCNKILKREVLHIIGKCPHCGAIKCRNLQVYNSEEAGQMKEWGIDPDFLALFEGINI